MNQINQKNIIQGVLIILGLCVLVALLNWGRQKSEVTLSEYAQSNPEIAYQEHEDNIEDNLDENVDENADKNVLTSEGMEIRSEDTIPTDHSAKDVAPATSTDKTLSSAENDVVEELIGKMLNQSEEASRITYREDFYQEPIGDNLFRYICGISFPSKNDNLAITCDELRYIHILHYNFKHEVAEGELICNQKIADDLLDIFYELYEAEYEIEQIRLIDEYDGDDHASMLDNNTSCFNYRVVDGSSSLSKHAYGLALDINPFYNPYITYNKDKSENISPEGSEIYADRTEAFPHKIDTTDLCYTLFTEHGFTWGGSWKSCKDYQHFQKTE